MTDKPKPKWTKREIIVGARLDDLLVLEITKSWSGKLIACCRCLCTIRGEECGAIVEVSVARLKSSNEASRTKRCRKCTVYALKQRYKEKRIKQGKENRRRIAAAPKEKVEPLKIEAKPVCICLSRVVNGKPYMVLNENCPVPRHGWNHPSLHTNRNGMAYV